MPTILVRGLEAAVVRQLKMHAAKRGHSMEEEVRCLIRERLAIPSRRRLAVMLLSVPGYGWEWPK